jgi:hypothetical protein
MTQRDRSGIFDAELKPKGARQAAVLDRVAQLSPKGITFSSAQFIPEWTEVDVQIRIPGGIVDQKVDCRGVVVQCTQHKNGDGFEIALLFLDLPKKVQNHLRETPHQHAPLHISVSR